jgi:hypothetical protein
MSLRSKAFRRTLGAGGGVCHMFAATAGAMRAPSSEVSERKRTAVSDRTPWCVSDRNPNGRVDAFRSGERGRPKHGFHATSAMRRK